MVLASKCKEIMAVAHASHIGIEGLDELIQETMFWLRISSKSEEYVAKRDICSDALRHGSSVLVQNCSVI